MGKQPCNLLIPKRGIPRRILPRCMCYRVCTPTDRKDMTMTNHPASGNAPGLTEDDILLLNALLLAIEVCSDALNGMTNPEAAKKALPMLAKLARAEVIGVSKVLA